MLWRSLRVENSFSEAKLVNACSDLIDLFSEVQKLIPNKGREKIYRLPVMEFWYFGRGVRI
jgi:hypothetical protein